MNTPDFWRLLAGISLFLYGMSMLEDSMKQLDGRGFKLFLQKHTKNKLSAIFSGTLVTGILQSSSIVNIMVLSFVGAGMLSMRNALGVVLGANIGGTFNSWLVALLGFKVDIGAFTLPIIGFAGIGLIIFKNKKSIYLACKFCMGLGLLFLGLAFMKDSMDSLIKVFDFTPYVGYNRIIFVLIGLIITSIIQTSAATVVIVLSALYAKVIPIETAVAVVLGAELGTTVKLLIGSIGGIAAKKRVAAADIIFNIFTTTIGFMLLVPIINLLKNQIGIHDPLFILVAFQTFINIAGTIIFYFFLNPFGDFLEKHFDDKKKFSTSFIQNANPAVFSTAIEMIDKEVALFIHRVMLVNMDVFQIKIDSNNDFKKYISKKTFLGNTPGHSENYYLLKLAEGAILAFYSKMAAEKMKPADLQTLNRLMASVKSAMYSAKGMKDIDTDRKEFSNSGNSLKYGIYKLLHSQLSEFYLELDKIFSLEDKAICFQKLLNLLEVTNKQYEERVINFYKDAETNTLKELDISTLFNVNRELYSSCKAIILSLKDYLLDNTSAEKFENESSFILK